MKIIATAIPELKIIEPRVFGDRRGFFMETWNRERFAEAGLDLDFVQDNHSRSRKGTLRGLHYQIRQPQGKLVRVIRGEVYDVAVDLRRSSPTFGQWVGVWLSEENQRMFWVPPGFAHGFYVVSETADFVYKCTDFYAPEHERCIRWNDDRLAVDWPLAQGGEPLISAKDRSGVSLTEAETYS